MSSSKGTGGGQDTPTAHAATAISSPDVSGPVPVRNTGIDPSGPATLDDHVGQTIADRYRILAVLGRGGMGTVYVGEHIQLKKRVALKLLADELHKQPALVQRFLKEARAAAQIGHPNIVDVSDLGELPGGGAFIAMALLEGEDLQSELSRTGPLPVARARAVIGQICRALAAAHGKGIIHRDMKPANVFLARDADGTEHVKVLDFGIAQVQEASGEEARLTQTGAIVGTPAFMSPEQGRGERADHRADVYSVGCILYNLVTGEVPFDGSSLMGVITKHLLDPQVPPSQRRPELGIDADIDAIVLRAMAKDPNERFQTMKDMWMAIEAGTESPAEWPDPSSGRYKKLTPLPASRVAATPRPPARSRRGLWLSIAGLVLGGAAAAIGVQHGRAQRTTTITPVSTSPPPVASPVAPPVAPPADVTIEIRSTPPGATVWEGDQALGKTPLRLVRARSAAELTLHVSSDGHADESLVLACDRDRLVDVRLQPASAPPPVPTVTRPAHAEPAAHKNGGAVVKKAGRAGDLKDPFSR